MRKRIPAPAPQESKRGFEDNLPPPGIQWTQDAEGKLTSEFLPDTLPGASEPAQVPAPPPFDFNAVTLEAVSLAEHFPEHLIIRDEHGNSALFHAVFHLPFFDGSIGDSIEPFVQQITALPFFDAALLNNDGYTGLHILVDYICGDRMNLHPNPSPPADPSVRVPLKPSEKQVLNILRRILSRAHSSDDENILEVTRPDKGTILHVLSAAPESRFYKRVFSILLPHVDDCSAQDLDGNTALHIALDAGSPFAKDLAARTKGMLANEQGDLPLHIAARTKNWDCMRTIFERSGLGEHAEMVSTRNAQGKTPFEMLPPLTYVEQSKHEDFLNELRPPLRKREREEEELARNVAPRVIDAAYR